MNIVLDETLRKSGIDFYNSITDSRNIVSQTTLVWL